MATKDLDFGNVIKMVYDPPTESLKVLATITIGSITVDLDAANDSVRLGDGVLLNTLTNVGGKNAIDVNIAGGFLDITIDQADDSIRLGDGTTLFTGSTVGPKTGLDVNIIGSPTVILDEPLLISGTDTGTISGTEYGYVYNQRQQVLAAHDREQDITYADFGTKDQRITQIDYTSPTFPGFIVRKIINYTLVSGRYRRDSVDWQIV